MVLKQVLRGHDGPGDEADEAGARALQREDACASSDWPTLGVSSYKHMWHII